MGSQGCSPVQSGSKQLKKLSSSEPKNPLPIRYRGLSPLCSGYGDSGKRGGGGGGGYDSGPLQRGQAFCRRYSGCLCRVLCLLEHHYTGPDLLEACLGRASPPDISLEIRNSKMPRAGGMLWSERIRILACPSTQLLVCSGCSRQRLRVQPPTAQPADPSRCLGTLKVSVSTLANWN